MRSGQSQLRSKATFVVFCSIVSAAFPFAAFAAATTTATSTAATSSVSAAQTLSEELNLPFRSLYSQPVLTPTPPLVTPDIQFPGENTYIVPPAFPSFTEPGSDTSQPATTTATTTLSAQVQTVATSSSVLSGSVLAALLKELYAELASLEAQIAALSAATSTASTTVPLSGSPL